MTRINNPPTISINGGENNVVETPLSNSHGSVDRFTWIWCRRITRRFHRAKHAATCTSITEYHYSRRGNLVFPTTPAVANIWAPRLFTDLHHSDITNTRKVLNTHYLSHAGIKHFFKAKKANTLIKQQANL